MSYPSSYHYETVYVLKSGISDADAQTIHSKIDNVIAKFQGKVIKRDDWGLQGLAYQINKDGSGQERLMTPPIVGKGAVSPDGEWVIVARAATEAGSSQESVAGRQETVAAPVGGGEPRRICQFNCLGGSKWSPDGRFLYIAASVSRVAVLPVPPGQSLPALPTSGVGSADDLFILPGVRTIERTVPVTAA